MKNSVGTIEREFAYLLWERVPLSVTEVITLAEDHFGWKRTTTYTVLKRLNQKGLFQNENGIVFQLMSKEQFETKQTEIFLEESFRGSLPAFIAAFSSGKKLSDKEIEALQQLIDESRERK
ncbi:MAG: BlaI/MecI/CopY family transcriptional regulator [Erysipelotrichaceae bacterium]|nr:BlaI/MecI/CopY family transcriptional regulator [Erysipelotrichaceae bacterium]